MSHVYPSGTITLVFTDIQGSSELWEQYREAFQPALEAHNRVMRDVAEHWNGREVKTEGDAFFLVFATSADAVQFAVEAQNELRRFNWEGLLTGLSEIRVRIGMHTGEPIIGRNTQGEVDYFGPSANRAARICAAGHGGQVLVSNATREVAEAHLPRSLTFTDLSLHRLKGVGEERLWQVCHADLPREFPPLRTLNPERHNLPVPPTPFIGREQDIDNWFDFLRQPQTRLVTLLGFGGMGKTRSALQLAEMAVEDFPDGVWWVPLEEARSSEQMLQQVASALRVHLQGQDSLKEQLLSYLRNRELLLVLDNSEQLRDAPAVVEDLLRAAPLLRVLVTSRRPLHLQAERLVDVNPLSVEDARALFVERARARKPDFTLAPENEQDVTALCNHLEGVPLALELAASRIRLMAPRDILSRLNQLFSVLQSRAPDLPARQRALRAAIDWSYDLLSEEDKDLFAQLSVFVGGFFLEDAESLCDALDVAWGIEELVNQSFVRSETDAPSQHERFTMLDSVRAYAAEKLNEQPEKEGSILEQHAQHFLRLGQERLREFRSEREGLALRLVELSLGNLRAAADWAAAQDRNAEVAEFSLSLGCYLQRRGFIDEAMSQIERGLTALGPLRDDYPRVHTQLLREHAGLLIDRCEWKQAEAEASEAVVRFEALQMDKDQANAYNLLGLIAIGRHDFSRARDCLGTARRAFEQVGDSAGVAMVVNNLGLMEFQDEEGDNQQARQHWQEALRLYAGASDERGKAEALTNLGVLNQDEGNADGAWNCYEGALAVERKLGHALGVGRSLSNLGEVAQRRGELRRAAQLLAAAVSLFDRIGSPPKTYSTNLLEEVSCAIADPPSPLSLKGLSVEEATAWAMGAPSDDAGAGESGELSQRASSVNEGYRK
ncbi:MAG: adenylate/guanylate cyclase domain-containing protein [Armatimonadetes bacterium]|nr:adenylate/guanylate cyclase domain-containing protein [Armatimonadota bacterium]PIY48757.1 MAG: hypothetical protein COZ05_02275 [Armatimonadetes bacterium CG_4_10_14_3_um_filter_59_10]PJB64039.1 MAG: hypothetical protein CO095_15320 [Armatimonadetes bacterium CG_4_9_14_3_um_filter_58_7]